MKANENLSDLYLSNKLIDTEGSKAIASSCENKKDLKNLYIDNKKFSAEGAAIIADIFKKIPVSKIVLAKNNV